MTASNLTAFSKGRKTLATKNHTYPTRPSHTIHIGRHRVAEEPDQYQSNASPRPFPQSVRKIEIDSLRQAMDAHIRRVLKLANVLDDPSALECTREERKLATDDLRITATLIEECFHALINTAEKSNQT